MPAKTSKKKKRGGAKSEKRKAEKDSRKQVQSALKHANAQADPLSLLPEALLGLSLSPGPSPGAEDKASDSTNGRVSDGAPCFSIEHRASPLPQHLLDQCLRHFEVNMGALYKRSNWGLDMEGKRLEMEHKNARFLLALKRRGGAAAGEGTAEGDDGGESREAGDAGRQRADDADAGAEVIGFAHYRFEVDDEDRPAHPVGYLYELQISSRHQKHGLGGKLMSLVERISSELKMEKVMLTVFKSNVGAMRFYERQEYKVDESSPSNFEGGETCDYEILSKSMTK